MKKAFEPLVDKNSKVIILGTMPGEKSLQLQQYYGNRGNQFWKIMFAILKEELHYDYEAKKDLLLNNGIALWDVLSHCEREGSLDSKIINEIPNDFNSLYKNYPHIKHVFFSSKNAEKFYDKYIGRREGIAYQTLPSPSGANATKRFEEKLEIWKYHILKALHLYR